MAALRELGAVVPVYFWKTREGNNTSLQIHWSSDVFLVSFFARRPKVSTTNSSLIQGKINYSLFQFSELAFRHHIPVFCGIPVAKNIFELCEPSPIWFHLDPRYEGDEPIFNITGKHVEPLNYSREQFAPVSNAEIISIIKQWSPRVSWATAIEIMYELYRKPENGRYGVGAWWTRNWRFKPIYFVIR